MAMTNLNVNYTPDGTYMTYNETGSLTSYDLQMSFGELEPIYADEFDDSSDDAIGSFDVNTETWVTKNVKLLFLPSQF